MTELDLETLKQIQFSFALHSDFSTQCNGYRSLCKMIEEHKQTGMTSIQLKESLDEAVEILISCKEQLNHISYICKENNEGASFEVSLEGQLLMVSNFLTSHELTKTK